MNTNSVSLGMKIVNFVSVFLTSAGLSYALVMQFILNQPNDNLLLITFSLFAVSVASWQRRKNKSKSTGK